MVVGANDKGQRLDRFLKKYFDAAPLSMIYKMIRKDVKVNGKRAKEQTILAEGDLLRVYISDEDAAAFHRERRPAKARKQFRIAYEDEDMLVVSKPFGLLTHGDGKEKKNTLANQVIGYLQEKGEYNPAAEQTFRPAPVNRLDRNTTGLVIFGKTAEATRRLAAQIKDHEEIEKYYLTIVAGQLKEERRIEGLLEKDETSNTMKVMSATGNDGLSEEGTKLSNSQAEDCNEASQRSHRGTDCGGGLTELQKTVGKNAVTIARPLKAARGYTLVEVQLITGRTHQIRAHLAAEGFPILGDRKYGQPKVNKSMKEKFNLDAQLLHAYRLVITEWDGHRIEIEDRLTPAFMRVKEGLFGE